MTFFCAKSEGREFGKRAERIEDEDIFDEDCRPTCGHYFALLTLPVSEINSD